MRTAQIHVRIFAHANYKSPLSHLAAFGEAGTPPLPYETERIRMSAFAGMTNDSVDTCVLFCYIIDNTCLKTYGLGTEWFFILGKSEAK